MGVIDLIGSTLACGSRGPWFKSRCRRKSFPLSFLSCDLTNEWYINHEYGSSVALANQSYYFCELFITHDVTIKYGLCLEIDLKKWTHKWQDLNPGSPSEKPPLCHMSQSFFLFFIHSFFWFVSFLYILSFRPKILIYYSFLCTSFWCINFVCDNGSVFIVFILNLTLILERKNAHLRILPDQIYSASV